MTYIARLRGEVVARTVDAVVLDVAGVGYRAFVPGPTAGDAEIGSTLTLHTHLQIRDDGASLFGFGHPHELSLFELLIGVSGVGPRSALALLSTMTADELRLAIAGGAAEPLRRVPGIGVKTAGRIILELQSKIDIGGVTEDATGSLPADDLAQALRGLGYTQQEVAEGIAATRGTVRSTEERLRDILVYFASRQR